jgi:hypothetical protein
MRAIVALALVAALGGCSAKTRSCKSNTVLITVDAPAGSDTIAIAVAVDGTVAGTQSVTLGAGTTHGTIELDFSSYPAGHTVDITVTAIGGGMTLGSASTGEHTLTVGCEAVTLTIGGTSGGGGDGGTDGGTNDDLSGGGCRVAANCPVGQACDPVAGSCTISCSASQACNGGCCDGAHCVTGTASMQCALGNALCGSCAGNVAGSACLDNGGASRVCGCTTASDCPANQACNTQSHTCGTACSASSPCNGGCCNGTTCQPGTADGVCGNTGQACVACAGNQNGFKCEPVTGGGQCGCAAFPADCPGSASSCSASHLCVNVCSAATPCQAGCCSIPTGMTMGTCMPGTVSQTCGAVGQACVSCSGNAQGTACLSSGSCGCTQTSDCPGGTACDTSLHKCTTTCNTNQPCNGGCCSTATGTCVAGGSTAACGSSGGLCNACAASTDCATYSCDGTTCQVAYAPTSTICFAADPENCTGAVHCTGFSATCPAPKGCLGGACCMNLRCVSPCP